MGANNPNNSIYGFPIEKLVNQQTSDLTSKISVGGDGFGVTSNVNFSGYSSGDRLKVHGEITVGTVTANLGWIQLPSGIQINTAPNKSTFLSKGYGTWLLLTNSVTAQQFGQSGYVGSIFCDGTNLDKLYFAYRGANNEFVKDNANAIFGNNFTVQFDFDIPIAQWQV